MLALRKNCFSPGPSCARRCESDPKRLDLPLYLPQQAPKLIQRGLFRPAGGLELLIN